MANVILITWHFSTRFCLTLSNMIKFINLNSLYRGQSTDQARFSKGAPKKDGGGQLSKICTLTYVLHGLGIVNGAVRSRNMCV